MAPSRQGLLAQHQLALGLAPDVHCPEHIKSTRQGVGVGLEGGTRAEPVESAQSSLTWRVSRLHRQNSWYRLRSPIAMLWAFPRGRNKSSYSPKETSSGAARYTGNHFGFTASGGNILRLLLFHSEKTPVGTSCYFFLMQTLFREPCADGLILLMDQVPCNSSFQTPNVSFALIHQQVLPTHFHVCSCSHTFLIAEG